MPNSPVKRERHRPPSATRLEPPGDIARRPGPESHPSGLAIIGSKIDPAVPARSILARARLVDWFAQHAGARLILVSAEAGYGKTTLLTEFALQTRDACAWYRLERSDRDWITFLSYMVATLRGIWPGFGKATEALLRSVASMGSSREVVLAQFLSDLSSAEPRRVAVILDDYHVVEASPDVRMIVSRMLELAPEGMYFVLGGRGAPNLALGRLTAQGRVHGLTIDDLRFSLEEIERLFSETYRQPLALDTCRMIAERTEGWAAGLQLVAASIAVSKPSEVADFIEALSGATGPIYDFLAEEVLTRLSPQTQQVLVHASLMDRVRPEYVLAAMRAGGHVANAEVVQQALDAVESIGLLSVRSGAPGGWRLQALFREFLAVQLQREASAASIRQMHHAVAAASESSDWLMSAWHYAHAGSPPDAMRVLGSAASEALGTGAWGAAVEILRLLPSTPPPAAVKVVQARALVSDERLREAADLLATIDRHELTPEERGLVSLTHAAIFHIDGQSEPLRSEVGRLVVDLEVPALLRDIAVSWQLVLRAARGGCITDAVVALRRLASDQVGLRLHYFAGVTLHNTATAELALGNYQQAVNHAEEAMAHLGRTSEGGTISASTLSIKAAAVAELGNVEEGLRQARAAIAGPDATADAIAEAAYLHAVCGRTNQARTLLARFDRGDARWARDPSTRALGSHARLALAISDGNLPAARESLATLATIDTFDFDAYARRAVAEALVAVIGGSADTERRVSSAMEVIASQNAWRWTMRAKILEAVVNRDGGSLSLWVSEAESDSSLAVLELADAIASAIDTLVPLPAALERSILREPARWIAALGRRVHGNPSGAASAAASLVAKFGSIDDISVLREFEKRPSGRTPRRGYATQLIRRVSPTVRVHDLGLTSLQVGDRTVALTETRRRAAALLLYLVTRTDLAANREQVMEALWPDQTPKSALNSLHQTIFVLRREFEPWYEDGATADYVHMDAELVRLDVELFQIDSVAFARQAADIIASRSAVSRGPGLLALYRGHFAPEFEYEDWTETWRTHLHTSFLRLAHAATKDLAAERRFGEVVEVLTPVVAIDPTAFDLRSTLVACLHAAGARDAAIAHYHHMAAVHERELGMPARRYDEIIRTVSSVPDQ